MEQLDAHAANDVEMALSAPRDQVNDNNDKKQNNLRSPCLNFQFMVDTDSEQKDDFGNECDKEQLKKDLLLKADEFFNSGCAKIENACLVSSSQQLEESSSPNGEVFLGLDPEQLEYDSNLLKYCVAMGIRDDVQVPLNHIDCLKDELNALEYCAPEEIDEDDDKPSYAMLDSLDMDSAESIEKVLNLPPFDPQEPQVRFIIKRALSLNTISRSKENVIQMFMPMNQIKEYMGSENFNPLSEHLNTYAKHKSDEFCTFCSCKECLSYREIVIHIMAEQFRASHMIVQLLDALIKAYTPLLRNNTAYSGFEKLLENNKDIYWIASGLIYNKKYEHLNLIYDETLTDPMVLVLFSSILMVNNPMQLLQILSFHVKCIIKAFAVGICEVPAEEKLAYIIDGFDHLCLVSDQVGSYFFMFEKYFLKRFALSWTCLCQRLFHQHVYMKFFVAITNSGESLKSDDPLKNRYFDFAKRIIFTDMRWNRSIWPKLQQFNLTDIEMKRRRCMLHVHHLFDAIVEDALRLPLKEYEGDNLFFEIQLMKDRKLAWQKVMAFAKSKWHDGFFNAPNTLILDFRCEKCGAINEQHESKCKCVTCSIGGDPFLPPSKMKNICLDCLLKQRKTNEESQQSGDSSAIIEADDEDLKDLLCTFIGSKRSKDRTKHLSSNISKMGFMDRFFDGDLSELGPEDPYHISWAAFKHLSQRERYIHGTIDEKYFCKNCNIPACILARKLLNNEISPELTSHLVSHFHPLPLLQHELRDLVPSIVFYNQRFFTSESDSSYHNVVVKAYWTFMVSLYTTYFFDFEPSSPLNLSAFEIEQSDIKLIPEKLTGDKEDTKFLEFLVAIRSFAPPDGGGNPASFLQYLQRDDVKQQLDNFLKTQEERRRKILSMIKVSHTTPSAEAVTTHLPHSSETTSSNTAAVTVQPTACNSMPEASAVPHCENQQKKNGNSKPKKCCLEHAADLGADHCKDSHAGKKRLKKDCSHARINETRDRLRKKLQDARKHQQQQQHQIKHQPPSQIKLKQQPSSQYPAQNVSFNNNRAQQPTVKSVLETAAAMLTSSSIYEKRHVCNSDSDGETLLPTTPPPSEEVTPNSEENEKPEKTDKVIGKVIEICDMIDNNKLKMKKWIDETLTYIEGYASTSSPTATNANKKTQPQTKNPKKAAKKAKQKMRKEEEKRIGELHEVRAQFQDIYFKEFVEKIELKSLKSGGISAVGKRRCDKKKISEIEANIKKLQRAKAKLEGNILELIATVKQTNTEFKFPYLPTKEQQQAKLIEIEHAKLPAKTEDGNSKQSSPPSLSPSKTASPSYNVEGNAFNYAHLSSTKFFPNISFPYEMSFPGGAVPNPAPLGYANGQCLPQKVGNSMCYAPPQQQLNTNVMAALAANDNDKSSAHSSPCSDPSKRIVTIRRVHNPNLPDPQVTVTARGSSPNEDKLLYTFINGQLVPTMQMSTATPNVDNANSNFVKSTKPEPANVLSVSKSKLKKERRRQARLDLADLSDSEDGESKERERAENESRKQKVRISKGKLQENKMLLAPESSQTQQRSNNHQGSTDRTISKESVAVEEIQSSTKANTTSKKTKRGEKQAEHSPVDSKKSQQQHKKPQNDEQVHANAAKSTQSKVEKKTVKAEIPISKSAISTVEIVPICNKVKTAKDQRRHKLVNHGQFDNNPYKSLHMQDSDSEFEMTASSCDEDSMPDRFEVNNVIKFEEVPESKSKVKQQKPTTQNAKNISNAAVQKGSAQHQTPSNTIPNENKGTSKTNARVIQEQRNTRSTLKKPTENPTTNGKILSQPTAIDRRPKQKETSNRTDSNRDYMPTGPHGNDRRQVANENAYNTKAPAPKVCQNTTQLGKKPQAKSPTTPALLKRNIIASTSTSMSNSITFKPSLHDSKTASKRAQRTKKKQDPQPGQKHVPQTKFADCGAGIPARMEHFNPNEVNIIAQRSYAPQQTHVDGLTRQFQGLQLPRDNAPNNLMPSYASVSANKPTFSGSPMSNVSIMDQLNRGVQVENLSLPPGITLTKVDPIKSEQLRQKSESIKRLSQPLQQTNHNAPIMAGGFQHHGSTIVAPPTANYLPAQYTSIHNAPNAAISGAVPLDQGNIIMVENISAKTTQPISEMTPQQPASNTKASSKSKRRRNKGKRTEENASNDPKVNTNLASGSEQPKMITLRNPMFHAGPAAAAATILQQPGLLPNRHGYTGESGGVSFPPPLPMDQPAAIIKNENGMFTIRNPALHQAVTNGLALSGYRQFGGNVSYYTPQEAVAEAARATQQHQVLMQKARMQATAGPTESFSYFSNNPTNNVPTSVTGPTTVSAATSPTKPSNKISITCSSVGDKSSVNGRNNSVKFDVEDVTDSTTARPSSAQKCISAIGSEIKNFRSHTNVDHLWSEYGQQESLSRSHENLTSNSTSIVGSGILNENKSANASAMLQDKYQQSSYYNGYEVFPSQSSSGNHISTAHSTPAPTPALGRSSQTTRSSNSLFDATVSESHMHHHAHHSCGDDSPPPTSLLGYSSSYLDDIPNTGVIRYDDAAFLKNLIPGQRLNKEVSIHNINESNHGRATSPMSHLVEITPVYSGNNKAPQSQDLQSKLQQCFPPTPATHSTVYQNSFNEFAEPNVFQNSGNNYLSLNQSDTNEVNIASNMECEQTYKIFNYDFETPTSSSSAHVTRQKSITDLNNMFVGSFTAPTHRTSPFLDDTTMDNFVQNLNALQISNSSTRSAHSQQQLNGDSGRDSAVLGNTSNSNSTNSTPASGWW